MKKFNAFISQVLVFVLISAVLTGCGGSTNNTSASTSTTESAASTQEKSSETSAASNQFKDHIEISLALWDINTNWTDGKDAVYNKISKDLNITLKATNLSWDSYGEKINIWAASGSLPDVFSTGALGTKTFSDWVEQGVVKQLPDLSKYPNLNKYMNLPDSQVTKYNGNSYAIPRLCYTDANWWAGDRAILVRKDWMEKLGYTNEPKNFEEFLQMLKDFSTKNPDGTKGVIGITTSQIGACYADWIFFGFSGMSPITNLWYKDANGKYMPSFMAPGTLEGFKALRRMYTEGVLDKDFATIKGDVGFDKFAGGKAGAIFWSTYLDHQRDYVYNKWTKNYPDKEYLDNMTPIHIWPAPDGNRYHFIQPAAWSESYINNNVDDKKLDRILSLYDYLISDEGTELLRYGIKDKDYTKAGDKIAITRPKDPTTGQFKPLADIYPFTAGFPFLVQWGQQITYADPGYNQDILKLGKDNLDWYLKYTKAPAVNLAVTNIITPAKLKFQWFDLVLNDMVKITLGTESVDKMYKDMIDNYNKKGLQEMINEVNAEATKQGIK